MTRKQKNKIVKKLREKFKRSLAGTLALYMFLTSIMIFGPATFNQSYALTGGPSQPEVQSFEPIGTSDMVDLFSGDFTYNIPLLDVEGYPINLAYHSGITMDQEASWVGLGWNVNVGTINRSMRGIPDDFDGTEKIHTETNMKPNRTVTLGSGFSGELFGFEALGFNADLGVSYNNYTGVGLSFGAGLNVNMLEGKLTAGLGINSSSSNGLSISPSLSLSNKTAEERKKEESLGLNIGTSFNSRGGLKKLTLSADVPSTKSTKYNRLVSMSGGYKASFDLGQQTYVPGGGLNMNSFAISGRFKLGLEGYGFDGGLSVDASYASQWIKDKEQDLPAYGYFNSEKGQNNPSAILDFNREKDGTVSNTTPALPITNYTYDIFSVSGQGVGGSYRGFRSDIGYVFDSKGSSISSSADLSAEYSSGQIVHLGANVSTMLSFTNSGGWTQANQASSSLQYQQGEPYEGYEGYYLREANEMSVSSDPNFMESFGGDNAAAFKLNKGIAFNTHLTNELDVQGGNDVNVTSNYRDSREKRNSIIQMLTIGQVKHGMGIGGNTAYPSGAYANNANDNQIGEIISLGTDGMRYVYGLPAYNTMQQEVTFAVGQTVGEVDYPHDANCSTGLITYDNGDNTVNNEWGVDNYFQLKETPAYAHSFLLTAVVSPDYVDLDNNGPSPKDLGSYTKFHYKQIDDYGWRTPYGENVAAFSRGLTTDPQDDKANYVFGTKELWYLDKIETKNFVAVFETEDRHDGYGVLNMNGAMDDSKSMQVLKTITLYSKPDYDQSIANTGTAEEATALKSVHFEYDYSMCRQLPNNIDNYTSSGSWNPSTDPEQGGKLTLKKVYFTYRDSKKGKLSPYEFTYGNNQPYNLKGYDRWGNYKPNVTTNACGPTDALSSAEYPYVEQDKTTQDDNAATWSLIGINLPSGGSIGVDLESDDYAYVQHKDAMQMLKIIGVGGSSNYSFVTSNGTDPIVPVSNGSNLNRRIYFELDPSNTTDINAYVKDIDYVYFRCLMQFTSSGGFDYVPGYAEIANKGIAQTSQGPVGWIDFKPVSAKDPGVDEIYSPIAVASAQFGRLHLPTYVWNSPKFDDNESFGADILEEVYQVFVENFKDGFKNPNIALFDKGRGINMVLGKSWIRLNNVNDAKLGGGVRVSSIRMYDNWSAMTDGDMTNFHYGQQYDYTTTVVEDGVEKTISSGVASYEPQIGGDENPWRQPYFYSKENILAPDDQFYQEEPFGESFFPSASVGYSYVTVKNLERSGVTRHATGEVHHEFYTSKDFPTITKMTRMDHKRDRISPFSILSILNFDTKDYFTASQGFVVELNDMNGKPKSQKVYQEDKDEPITQVEYYYKSEGYSAPLKGIKSPDQKYVSAHKLSNSINAIYEDGTVAQEEIGVVFDAVADFRQSSTMTLTPSANLNLDAFLVTPWPVPIPIPTVWPSYQQQRTRFRSAGFTKVIQRFGVLDRTVAKDLGSVVETNNLAYDAETGNVLLTQTTTDFNDKIYTLNFPAYWHYDNMGPAYRNIDFTRQLTFSNGVANTSSADMFVSGDELVLVNSNTVIKGWVISSGSNQIEVQQFDGSPVSGPFVVKITRSGRRNMQMQNMASITTLKNPLSSISSNLYEEVIQASAIEYNDEWRTYCDCLEDDNGSVSSSNPYVLGTKGNYRPIVSYLPLSDRVQSDYNNNTNIREDGVFERYRPYYYLHNGKWKVDREDWTYTAEVTEFNPFGQELENRDALGRYSGATFGFNQTLAKSVAANARYREIGFTSFEDDDFSECADNHFKFDQTGLTREDKYSHSGLYSVKVTPTNSASLTRSIADWCEPIGCTLDVTPQTFHGSTLTLVPSGGTPDYVVDWTLVSGTIPTGFGVNPSNGVVGMKLNSDYEMTVSWVDSEGCSVSYKIVSHSGNQQDEIIKLN